MGATPQAVSDMFDRYASAWASNDPVAVAGFFTLDGSIINPFGERADGRQALEGLYRQYFAGMLKGTTMIFNLQSVRLAGDEHALVDGEQEVIGADGQVLLALHLTTLLVKESGDWKIADARPYGFAPAPGG